MPRDLIKGLLHIESLLLRHCSFSDEVKKGVLGKRVLGGVTRREGKRRKLLELGVEREDGERSKEIRKRVRR